MQTFDMSIPHEILSHLRENIAGGMIALPCVCTVVTADRCVLSFELDEEMRPTVLAARHSGWTFPMLLTVFAWRTGEARAHVIQAVPTPTAAQAEA